MNVLLLAIDTLRADHLGCYGYRRPTSPAIDALAAGGTCFARCYSQAPWTIPSFTTIMSGRYPESHRVVGSPWNVPNAHGIAFDDTVPVLAEVLHGAGYVTAAFDNLHQMASHPKWFVRGYRYYVNVTDRPGLVHHHVRADELHAELEPWLEAHRRDRFFAFVHYWEPHLPYNQPPPYAGFFPTAIDVPVVDLPDGERYVAGWGRQRLLGPRALQAISDYDGEIRFVDEYVGRVVGLLRRLGLTDETLVVVTADHGECMVEHGVLFNHFELYEPTVHVPLIFAGAGVAAGRFEGLVEHVDVMPTILDMAGVPAPPTVDGRSLRPHFGGVGTAAARSAVHAVQDGPRPCRMLRTQEWKLLERLSRDGRPPVAELYHLPRDPFETDDQAAAQPAVVSALREQLGSWLSSVLGRSGATDPLLEPSLSVDFEAYPGDPVLAEFYRGMRADRPHAAT